MKRLFALVLTAFVFAFLTPVAAHNAAAQTGDAATNATGDAMKGDDGAAKPEKKKHHGKHHHEKRHAVKHHHKHTAPANENTKTDGTGAPATGEPSDSGK